MYKDPAFLFYPEAFLVGVMYMTDEEIGQYIKLLCIQHQKGHIPDSIMQKHLSAVQEKFIQDQNGAWYNERLEKEIAKRAKWTESRRRNLEGRKPDDKKDGKPRKKETVTDWVKEIVPEELQEPFLEWAKMRAHMKKPIPSKQSVVRNYNRLCKLARRTDSQKRIIEQSIDRCWNTFYELKEKPPAYKEMKKEAWEQDDFVPAPMPEEVMQKADALGIRIGGQE